MAPPKVGTTAARFDADRTSAVITDVRGSFLDRGAHSMLLAGRTLLSLPWPGLLHDDYRWEHCFWIDNDDFDNNGQMGLAVVNDMRLFYTHQVRLLGTRWYYPGTATVYFGQTYPITQIGAQPNQANYNLLIAARWRMRGDDGSYSYHLHRQPVGEDYIEGGEWNGGGYLQQQTRMLTFLDQEIYRTRTGALLTTGAVAHTPVQWQMRHGTKRRNSRFWLP